MSSSSFLSNVNTKRYDYSKVYMCFSSFLVPSFLTATCTFGSIRDIRTSTTFKARAKRTIFQSYDVIDVWSWSWSKFNNFWWSTRSLSRNDNLQQQKNRQNPSIHGFLKTFSSQVFTTKTANMKIV